MSDTMETLLAIKYLDVKIVIRGGVDP